MRARTIFLVTALLAGMAILTLHTDSNARALRDLSDPGVYHAGWKTVTVPHAGSGTFSAKLYYPALATGANAAFDGSGGPYPVITFANGFLSDVEYYNSTLEHLATNGYFVIASLTYSGFVFSSDHANFALEMRECLTFMETENSSSASAYYHKVKTSAFGASGHSMGGGVSILAAADDARIKAVANMAAEANTTPPASEAVSRLHAPLRLLAGSADTITPITEHQQVLYDNANAPRQLAVLQGGYHCGFLVSPASFPGLCDSGSMAAETELAITRAWLTAWFNYYLKNDTSLENLVWGSGLHSDSRVVVTAQKTGGSGTPTPIPTATIRPEYKKVRLPLVFGRGD